MNSQLSQFTPIIANIASAKAGRVVSWLFEQESVDATVFHLTSLFDPLVMPDEVQLFLLYLSGNHGHVDHTPEYEPEEIRKMVEEAFALYGKFLSAPQAFILNFLLDSEFELSDKASALRKITTLGGYPYFREFLHEWVSEQPLPITKQDLTEAVFDIDKLAAQYVPQEQLAAYISPLVEFFKDRPDDLTLAVRLFSSDKHITPEYTGENDAAAIAAFIKSNIETATLAPQSFTIDSEIDYPVFLDELKQAGINLPPPVKFRSEDSIPYSRSLPFELFLSNKVKDRTIDDLFHGNTYEYDRMTALINNALTIDEAILNLETVLHLQNARPTPKHLAKLERAIRMKFSLPESTNAIR
jgi:hypothetical protein